MMPTASPSRAGSLIHAREGRSTRTGGGSWVERLAAAAVIALAVKIVGGGRSLDLDMFHQLGWFREALVTSRPPLADVWAYTPTLPLVVHHEWGTGAVLYAMAVMTGWGAAGIAALRMLLYAGILALAYSAARRREASGPMLVVTAPVALALLAPGLAPVRAHMFTFLFVALLMVCIEADRRGARAWVWGWLAACAVWVNLHGGFIAGYGLFALYTLERFARTLWTERRARTAMLQTGHLWAVGAGMALLACATPYGVHNVSYLWHAVSMERVLITEWAPLWSDHASPTVQAVFALSVLFALYAGIQTRASNLGITLLLAAGWMAVQHHRFTPIYAVVWFALVPALLTRTPFGSLLYAVARWRISVAVLAAVLLLVSGWRMAQSPPWALRVPTDRGDDWIAPAGAVNYLRIHGFRGNLMTDFNAGAYVSWHLHPAVRVGMDSRYEAAYPPGALEENVGFYLGEQGWERTLARYPTDAVLVPSWSPLDSLLTRAGEWRQVYRDDTYSVFTRPALAAEVPFVDRSGERIEGSFP